jgi:hypothetical protein
MNPESTTETPRRLFYGLAMTLLSFAVVSTVVQKGYESGCGTTVARRIAEEKIEAKTEALIWNAGCWQFVGLAAISLALLSCGIATNRRENYRWVWVGIVVLLSIYVMLELLMV